MNTRPASPSILIVDSEVYICRVFEAKLSRNNQFQVATATHSAEAVQAAIRQPFDVILWDTTLRNSEALCDIRALCPDAALILSTTDDQPSISEAIARLEIADILVKPLHLDTLVERIRAVRESAPAQESGQMTFLSVGQAAVVRLGAESCRTRILHCAQDSFTIVGAPRVAIPANFVQGARVRVEIQGQDALYHFDTRLRQPTYLPIPGWELPMPSAIRRAQRRRHPRYSVQIAARLLPSLNQFPLLSGWTEDLSMSGMAILSEQDAPIGEAVVVALSDPPEETNLRGRIIRTQPLSPNSMETTGARHLVVVQFDALDATTRHRLQNLLVAQERSER